MATAATFDFSGSEVVVIGASRAGIGAAIARAFQAAGATVTITGIENAPAEEDRGRFGYVRLDVQDMQAVAEFAASRPRTDILVNCAAITARGEEMAPEFFQKVVDINLHGTFRTAVAFHESLKAAHGSLINIASNAGLMGQAYTVPYCATKGGVVNLTRALAMEFVKTGVRINAIAPGGIDTPLVHNFQLADDIDFSLMQNHIGYRDPSSAEQIAAFFVFLASDEAANIHGSILSADGGLTTA